MKKKDMIDRLFQKIPVLKNHATLQRLTKFVLSAFLIYMVCKAPVMLVLTEICGVHYVLSGFIAGSVLTLLNFVPSEYWVWRKPK